MSDIPSALPDWLNVSRETLERMAVFGSLVAKWNPAINLVSKSSLPLLWDRHILDSAQIALTAPSAKTWLDLGSGGGFPSIVVAIMLTADESDMRFTLVEADQRKATFLRVAASTLGLPISVLSERIEDVQPQHADVLSARALASLDKLCGFAHRHLSPSGTAVFPKGTTADAEIAEARQKWNFDLSRVNSYTDPEAAILVLRNISHV